VKKCFVDWRLGLDFKLEQFMDLGLNSKVNNNQIAFARCTNLLSNLFNIALLFSRISIKRKMGHEFDTFPKHVCDTIIGVLKKDVGKPWEVEISFQPSPFSASGFF
jgi:hypothetical protein